MQITNQSPCSGKTISCSAIVAESSNIDNSVQKTVGVSLSGRPAVDTGKTMAEYESIAVADSSYTDSVNLAHPFTGDGTPVIPEKER